MKTLEEYVNIPYKLNIIKDTEENTYTASFPELKGCITCASTIESVLLNVQNAKREWIAAALEEGISIPEPNHI